MLQKILKNAVLLNVLFIKDPEKIALLFQQKYEAAQLFSALIIIRNVHV